MTHLFGVLWAHFQRRVVGALCLHVHVRVPSWLNGRHTGLANWLAGWLSDVDAI